MMTWNIKTYKMMWKCYNSVKCFFLLTNRQHICMKENYAGKNHAQKVLTRVSLVVRKLANRVGTKPGAMQLTRVLGPISPARAYKKGKRKHLTVISIQR